MSFEGRFLRETTIYVSTSLKLNLEQTKSVTDELLRIIGYPNYNPGFKFEFIDKNALTQANASVDDKLKVSLEDCP